MGDALRLTRQQGIAVAQLTGTATRHADGRGDDDPVAELHGITTDPRLLGIAASPFYLDQGDARAATALQLLRTAGADEQTIVQRAEQVREWRNVPTWH